MAVGENPKYVGTCQYIAPELLSVLREAHGRHVVTGASNSFFDADVRRVLAEYGLEIDIYSVGVFVFFCLSGGKLPFWTRGDDGELHELKSLDAEMEGLAPQRVSFCFFFFACACAIARFFLKSRKCSAVFVLISLINLSKATSKGSGLFTSG